VQLEMVVLAVAVLLSSAIQTHLMLPQAQQAHPQLLKLVALEFTSGRVQAQSLFKIVLE